MASLHKTLWFPAKGKDSKKSYQTFYVTQEFPSVNVSALNNCEKKTVNKIVERNKKTFFTVDIIIYFTILLTT